MEQEQWRTIPNFSKYSASTFGRIRRDACEVRFKNGALRHYPELILQLFAKPDGYLTVGVTDDTGQRTNMFVARLVAFAWIPNPDNKPEIDHVNRSVSDNRVSNLRWVTRSDNNHNRVFQTNSGEQYITKEVVERFLVHVPNSRKRKIFATLEDAVRHRDELLSSLQACDSKDTSQK